MWPVLLAGENWVRRAEAIGTKIGENISPRRAVIMRRRIVVLTFSGNGLKIAVLNSV